jgi:GPH family glycoside/pentoside/hexuronide:cation symporter
MSEPEKTTTANSRKPLSFSLKYLFGVGDAGFKLMSNIETFYFTFFLTNVAQFATGLVALVGSIVSIVDLCLSWVYGGILNSTKAMKWGRYRSWLMIMPWIVPFLFAFQFIKIGDNVALSAFIIVAAGIISHIVWNFPYTANSVLISVVGKTPDDRATMASSRATWNNIGGIAFSYLGLPFATVLAGLVGESNKFAAAIFCLGLLMAAGYLAHFKMTKGYEEIETANSQVVKKNKIKVRDMLKALFQNPTLMFLIIADLARWCVNFLVSASAIYYFKYTANNMGLQATYILCTGIAGVIGAYVLRYLAKKFSSRTCMIAAYIAMAVVLILAYFCYASPALVICLLTINIFCYGMTYAASQALYADTVVYATWKTGKDASGWIMGLQTLPLKLAIFLKGLILPAVLAAVAFSPKMDPATMTEAARQGLTTPLTLIPGVFCIVGALLLIFGFRLTKEKVAQYQAEIDKKG